MVDSLVVIVHRYREDFLGQLLSNHVPVQILHDLLRWRRRLSLSLGLCVLDGLFRVDLAQDYEEVMAFLTLDEPRRADEGFDVRARISALWTGQDVLLVWRFLAVAILATTATTTRCRRSSTAGPRRRIRTIL